MSTIIVNECDLTKGHAGRFEARLDGRLLCTSRQPFLDAARKLIAEGHDPDEVLVMRRPGSEIDALKAKLGDAAKLTVHETDDAGPYFRRYRPFPGSGAMVRGS